MRFRFFTIPAFDPDAAQDALNAFCAQQRVVAVDKHFIPPGEASFWAVCVTGFRNRPLTRRPSGPAALRGGRQETKAHRRASRRMTECPPAGRRPDGPP